MLASEWCRQQETKESVGRGGRAGGRQGIALPQRVREQKLDGLDDADQCKLRDDRGEGPAKKKAAGTADKCWGTGLEMFY